MKITKFKPKLQPAVGDLSDVEAISKTIAETENRIRRIGPDKGGRREVL